MRTLGLELDHSAFKDTGDLKSYVHTRLMPTWTTDFAAAKYLNDYRDITEATAEKLGTALPDSFPTGLKSASDKKAYCLATLQTSVVAEKDHANLDFTAFRLQCVVEAVLNHARSVNGIYPVLAVPREIIESVVDSMAKGIDHERLKGWAQELKSNVWTALGLYAAVHHGDAEDLFLHAPLPKVFGAPCQARDVPKETTNPKQLTKTSKYEAISIDRAVLAGHGSLCYKPTEGAYFKVFDLEQAELVAVLPGAGGAVWCANPITRKAVIVALEPKGPRRLLEFELPDDNVNWIDCQRDAEGLLVLLWGHVDTLTGSGPELSWAALDEYSLHNSSSSLEFRDSIVDLPDRRRRGCRVDFRDHGNLLSVVRTTKDAIDAKGARAYEHTFNIMFGNSLIWTYESRQRPIEAVFGGPSQMLLLSPFSSTPLQLWALKDANERMWYQSVATSTLPPSFVPKSVAAY